MAPLTRPSGPLTQPSRNLSAARIREWWRRDWSGLARRVGGLGRPRLTPAAVDAPDLTVRAAARAWDVSKSTAARWMTSGRLPEEQPTTAP